MKRHVGPGERREVPHRRTPTPAAGRNDLDPRTTALQRALSLLTENPGDPRVGTVLSGLGDLMEGLTAIVAQLHAMQHVVDRLRLGIITLDGGARLGMANRTARRILDAKAGLTVRNGTIVCTDSGMAKMFTAATERACGAASSPENRLQSTLAIPRDGGRRALGVLVMPLPPAGHGHSQGKDPAATALLTLSDPDADLSFCSETISAHLGLTPAEARLAVALAGGMGLAEYAAQVGITIGTARWTAKQAMEKTGCSRQSQLVRLVTTSVAGMVLDLSPRN